MLGAETSTLRIPRIPEILEIVFRGSDKRTLSQCTRVCKSWSPVAVYCLWRELDSVLPLLQLLGDFKIEGRHNRHHSRTATKAGIRSNTLSFTSPPSEECWRRFHGYASLVTSLCISKYSCYSHKPYFTHDVPVHFSTAMLGAISNGQKHPHLLPNITSLRVDASDDLSLLSLATLFFGQLKQLEIFVDVQPHGLATAWTPLKGFFSDAIYLSPHLESFGIKAMPGADSKWSIGRHPHHSGLGEVIRDYLTSLGPLSLTTVEVNSTMFTTELFHMLSRFPRIRSIRNSGRRMYYTPKLFRISSPLPSDAFPELKELFLPTEAQSASTLVITLRPILENLTSLTIGCRDYVIPSACQDLFIAISQCCPLLSCLEIMTCTSSNIIGGKFNRTAEWSEEYTNPDSREHRLRRLALDPIFDLQFLKDLTLLLDFVIPIGDHELEKALLRRRTPFEILQLSWTPRRMDLDEPGLSLDALRIIARYCPRIRILSLFIGVKPPTDQSLPSSPSFACLQELNFGLSVIPHTLIQSTAEALCDLFRDHSLPDISASLHTGYFSKCQLEPESITAVQVNHARWKEVVYSVNSMRNPIGKKLLRRFARSECRIVDRSRVLET